MANADIQDNCVSIHAYRGQILNTKKNNSKIVKVEFSVTYYNYGTYGDDDNDGHANVTGKTHKINSTA